MKSNCWQYGSLAHMHAETQNPGNLQVSFGGTFEQEIEERSVKMRIQAYGSNLLSL